MASKILDLTGLNGLTPKYQGDLNSDVEQPHLRYLGSAGQMAAGIYNPYKKHGYLSPANKTFSTITGTIADIIVATEYDEINQVGYFLDASGVFRTLDGLDDTSLTEFSDLSSSYDSVDDLQIYQINGTRVLLHTAEADDKSFSYTVGFHGLDSNSGAYVIDSKVVETRGDNSNEIISSGLKEKLGQTFEGDDVIGGTLRSIRLRIGTGVADTTDVEVSIQTDSVGVPDGVKLATKTINATLINSSSHSGGDVFFDFGTDLAISGGTTYWIVLESPDYGSFTTETILWKRTNNDTSLYPNGDAYEYVSSTWSTADSTAESFDFSIINNNNDAWFTTEATGEDAGFPPVSSRTNFLEVADNGFCYWITGNQVHRIDGGLSGGGLGTIEQDILIFPEYVNVVDALDLNGQMNLAIQSTDITTTDSTISSIANICGIYTWDRKETIVGNRNFITLPGVKKVRRLFNTRDGVIHIITTNNDKQTEIWAVSGTQAKLRYQLGVDAYPRLRDSLTMINDNTTWLGKDGIFYSFGRVTPSDPDLLYKIGDASVQTESTFTSGALLTGNESAGQEQAIFTSWIDNTTDKLSKWYPHGEGTIDSNVQNPLDGNIYTLVQRVGSLSKIHRMMIVMLPNAGSGTTTVANIKIYFNQSTTEWSSKAVTKDDIRKGYLEIPIDKPNINSYQLEIEYVDTETLGTSEFNPIYAEVFFDGDKRNNK